MKTECQPSPLLPRLIPPHTPVQLSKSLWSVTSTRSPAPHCSAFLTWTHLSSALPPPPALSPHPQGIPALVITPSRTSTCLNVLPFCGNETLSPLKIQDFPSGPLKLKAVFWILPQCLRARTKGEVFVLSNVAFRPWSPLIPEEKTSWLLWGPCLALPPYPSLLCFHLLNSFPITSPHLLKTDSWLSLALMPTMVILSDSTVSDLFNSPASQALHFLNSKDHFFQPIWSTHF